MLEQFLNDCPFCWHKRNHKMNPDTSGKWQLCCTRKRIYMEMETGLSIRFRDLTLENWISFERAFEDCPFSRHIRDRKRIMAIVLHTRLYGNGEVKYQHIPRPSFGMLQNPCPFLGWWWTLDYLIPFQQAHKHFTSLPLSIRLMAWRAKKKLLWAEAAGVSAFC